MSSEVDPAHYRRFPVEVIDIAEHLPFNLGNVVKYVARAGYKPDTDLLTDLEKARWYLDREIGRVRKEMQCSTQTKLYGN